jgi:hypothetical protein
MINGTMDVSNSSFNDFCTAEILKIRIKKTTFFEQPLPGICRKIILDVFPQLLGF